MDYEKTMESLKKDEEEAIEAYEKAIEIIEDENVKSQLEKILAEEKAHLDYLEKAISDPSAEYSDPVETEEENCSEEKEEVDESFDPEWME